MAPRIHGPTWSGRRGQYVLPEDEFQVAWLDAKSWLVYTEPPPPEERRWFQHWGVWAGIGTAVIVGIAASAKALRPEPDTRFETTIRFNDL